MMFFSRCRYLFARAEDVSAACLLLIYPIALLATVWIYPVWERYGIRFQVLCNSALVAMAVVLCSADAFKRFSIWFCRSRFIYLVPLWLSWLIVMGFIHGFSASQMNGQGLLSGILLALVFPFVCYIFTSIKSRWILIAVPVLIAFTVFCECLFLSMYTSIGVGHNDHFTFFGDEIPRVFLNTRDGGSWAVALSIYVFYLWLRLSSRLGVIQLSLWENAGVCLALVPACYLALITSARGIVVSIAMAVLLSFLSGEVRLRKILEFVYLNLLSLSVAQLCLSLFRLSIASSYQLHERLVQGDSARFQLIQSWLASFQADRFAWFWGKGFNYYPRNFLPEGSSWPTNVHNLYVQFIVDTGALGLMVAVLSVWIILRGVRSMKIFDSSLARPMFVYALAAFFVYSATSALLVWPSGMWISMLLLLIPIDLGRIERAVTLPAKNYINSGTLGWKIPFYLIFVLFLVIQIPLVAHRHTFLAEMVFRSHQ